MKKEKWERRPGPFSQFRSPYETGSKDVRRGIGELSNLLGVSGVGMGKSKGQSQQLSNSLKRDFRKEVCSFPYSKSGHREREGNSNTEQK